MSSVDNRIVEMRFNNSQFEQGASTTLSTLDKLKQSLGMAGATKGLEEVSAAAGRFNLGPMEGAVTGVSKSFLALTTIALTAISNITTKVMSAGAQWAKSFTIQPLMEGFGEYELKMGSIQTILSNTARYGTGLDEVTKNLDALNKYADKTIYNFGDMTKNIGLFTNAGIRIEDATSMIKGFSNEAASSGTNAQGAASAAYQLSQALSAGTIRLMDWRSLQNVGMGNKNMQNGLIEIADSMGKLNAKTGSATDIQKNFNGSLEKNWLSADVMSSYLKIMAGDMSEAEQKALGLTDAQIKMFAKQQKMSEDAATKVRTFTQLVGTLRESAGSSWAESFDLIIGDFDQATDLWTSVNDTLGGMLQAWGDRRNDLIKGWADLGGRRAAIDAIGNAFHALMDVMKPIKEAFREIFPPATAQQLYFLTIRIRNFTAGLKLSDETAENLKRTFKGVFAVFSIASQIIKGIVGVIGDLVGQVASGTGGFLNFTGGIGDFLVRVDEALKKGTGLTTFFSNLSTILQVPINILKAIAGYIGDLFGGFNQASADGMTDSFGRISDRLSPLQTLIEKVSQAFASLPGIFGRIADAFKPVIIWVSNALAGIGQALGEAFSSGNFDTILDTINTALFGGLVLLIKKWMSGGGIFGKSGVTDMFGSVTGAFESLSGVLTTMQQNVKADILLKIAGAVALLTVSIVALSLIDSAALTKAMTAIAVGFGELLGAMKILEQIGGSGGFVKIPVIATSMILLATAMLVLSAAVKVLSTMSWGELLKGLTSIAVLLGTLSVATKFISENSSGMMRAGAGILILSVALKVLASAVEDFGEMDWGTIGKGLVGVAGALLVVAGTMKLMPTSSMVSSAAAILILSVALKMMASAITDFAAIGLVETGKGLLGIAAALVVIGLAMRLMPSTLILTAAGLVVLSVALAGIGKVLQSMGNMSWGEIVKGLITLAGALLVIAGGLYLMTGTLAGSAALMVAAVALALFVPILKTLGNMSWGEIIKGLLALAGVFAVVGLAGLALSPIIPVILLLGVSLLAIGAGLALAGAGALAFATAIAALSAVAGAAATVIGQILATIISSIPEALKAFGEGVIAFADAIANGGPQFVAAMVTVMLSILKAIQIVAPQIGKTFEKLIDTLLGVLVNSIPKMVDAGMKILKGVLKGISDNIYEIISIAGEIVVKLIRGIGNNSKKIVDEGANAIIKFVQGLGENGVKIVDAAEKAVIKFVNGIADSIRDNSDDMRAAGRNIASAIADGLTGGLWSKVDAVKDAAVGAAKSALNAAKNFLKIGSPSKEFAEVGRFSDMGFANGLEKYSYLTAAAAETVGSSTLDSMRAAMARVSDTLAGDIDINPTITPVLDLSQVQKDVTALNSLIASQQVLGAVSFGQATGISADQQSVAAHVTETPTPVVQEVKFEQNNYSPKALSATEIYRNTKNQLALAKEELAK